MQNAASKKLQKKNVINLFLKGTSGTCLLRVGVHFFIPFLKCSDIYPVAQFPISHQKKPLPRLLSVVPQTQFILDLVSFTKIQDVPALFHFALHYTYQHIRENRVDRDLRRQSNLSPSLKANLLYQVFPCR